MDPEKTEAVRSFPVPRTQHDVRSFLGLCNYYRKFVQNYSKITDPLNALLAKDAKFKWTPECQDAFECLQDKLISAPILKFPNFDFKFILTTDSSRIALGYILSQKDCKGREHVIAYGGRSLKASEKNYGITELECLSVIDAIDKYYVYLTHQPFTIVTDHFAIKYIQNFKHQNPRLLRWSLKLQNLDFTVEYKQGSKNTAADCLSRRQYPPQKEDTNDNQPLDLSDPSEIIEISFDDQVFYEVQAVDEEETNLKQIADDGGGDEGSEKKDDLCHTEPTVMPTELYDMNEEKQNQIIQLQQQCPYFKHIYGYLKYGILPEDKRRAYAIPIEANQYILMKDVLYHLYTKRIRKATKDADIVQQLAVPFSLRNDILLSYHDSISGGCHLGIQKTYEAIRQKYFWPGMYQHIYDYIASCNICQRIKRNVHQRKSNLHPLPIQDVFCRWHMDILGGYPKQKKGINIYSC